MKISIINVVGVIISVLIIFGSKQGFAQLSESATMTSMTTIADAPQYDKYGGWTGLKSQGTGFFRTEKINGIWWLIDPDGNVFVSKGVDDISYTAGKSPKLGYAPYGKTTSQKYGDATTWAKAAIDRLRSWNFNTIGAWSSKETYDKGMPYTFIANIGASAGGSWLKGIFPDVFSEKFQTVAAERAKEFCEQRANDPNLLGYFLDNELRWGPNWSISNTLFDDFFPMPADAAMKKALVNVLKEMYGSIDKLNAAWHIKCGSFDQILTAQKLSDLGKEMEPVEKEIANDNSLSRFRVFPRDIAIPYLTRRYSTLDSVNAKFKTHAKTFDEFLAVPQLSPVGQEIRKAQSRFLKAVAEQYFKVCRDAIRKFDKNHLILGCRFAGYALPEVAEGMKDYIDMISFNDYSVIPPLDRLQALYDVVGKPMMITEFSFKAMDSGLPNTKGAGFPLKTQQERADCFAGYVKALLATPYAVGFHWFEHADQPAEGRGDGENSNYGVVNVKDEPWKVLTDMMTVVNGGMEQLHAKK